MVRVFFIVRLNFSKVDNAFYASFCKLRKR